MHSFSPSTPTTQSLWSRFAAFLSFMAVLSVLLAPVSMLAQDVQSGKLGGVCSLNNPAAVSSNADGAEGGDAQAQPKGAHCDLCGAPGVVLASLVLLVIPTFPGGDVAAVFLPADRAASVFGLPFGRGPPFDALI